MNGTAHRHSGSETSAERGFTSLQRFQGQYVLGLLPLSTHESPGLLVPSQSFGPSAIVSGLAYLLLRLSALECLTSLADGLAYYAVC